MANILVDFGKAALNEIKRIFGTESSIVIPFSRDSIEAICTAYDNLDLKKVDSAIKNGFKQVLTNSWFKSDNPYISLSYCIYEVMIAYECVATFNTAYNSKLCSFIGISESDLQSIYGKYTIRRDLRECGSVFQEYIWEEAKDLLRKHNLRIDIPEHRFWAGRFVQYPKSQQVINISTLRAYQKKFEGQKVDRDTFYSIKQFSNCFIKGQLSQGSNASLPTKEKEDLAKKILFYCFSQYLEERMKNDACNISADIRIELNEEHKTFELYYGTKKVNSINDNCIGKAFVYDEVYNDWIFKRNKIDKNRYNCLGMIFDSTLCWKYKGKLTNSNEYSWSQSGKGRKYSFFVNPQEYIKDNFNMLFKNNAVIFLGGVCDQSSRSKWIRGLLPSIKVKERNTVCIDYMVYELNEEFLDLESLNLPSGLHFIRVPNQTSVPFEITDVDKAVTMSKGWYWRKDFSCFESRDKGYILSGLSFSGDFKQSESRNNHWGNRKIEAINDKYNRFENLEFKGE